MRVPTTRCGWRASIPTVAALAVSSAVEQAAGRLDDHPPGSELDLLGGVLVRRLGREAVGDDAGDAPGPQTLGGTHGEQGGRLHLVVERPHRPPCLQAALETPNHPSGEGVVALLARVEGVRRDGHPHVGLDAQGPGGLDERGGAGEVGHRRKFDRGEVLAGAVEPNRRRGDDQIADVEAHVGLTHGLREPRAVFDLLFLHVYRIDRGVGKSTGQFSISTSEDFAKDVSSSVDYLLSRPEVDKKKIGLIGHSEGGMIAPMVATQRKDINFIVLLAGPGVKIIDLMAEQNEAIAKSGGVSEEALKEIKPLFKKVVTAIMETTDSSTAITNVTTITETWAAAKSSEILKELNFETAKQRKDYIIEMVKEFQSPWFRYFISFNPAQYIEKLHCKVLALNGDKDIQVISRQNLPGIETSLKKSRSKVYEVKELQGLNHLFQTCKKCTLNEYGELEETISPAALQVISDWLIKNIQ